MAVLDISDDALTIERNATVSDISLDTGIMAISTSAVVLDITNGA